MMPMIISPRRSPFCPYWCRVALKSHLPQKSIWKPHLHLHTAWAWGRRGRYASAHWASPGTNRCVPWLAPLVTTLVSFCLAILHATHWCMGSWSSRGTSWAVWAGQADWWWRRWSLLWQSLISLTVLLRLLVRFWHWHTEHLDSFMLGQQPIIWYGGARFLKRHE